MRKALKKRIAAGLYHIHEGRQIPEAHGDLSGYYTSLRGDCTNLRGDCSGLRGDCSGLRGDCSGIYGDCTNIEGNIDDCGITYNERFTLVDIESLVIESEELR